MWATSARPHSLPPPPVVVVVAAVALQQRGVQIFFCNDTPCSFSAAAARWSPGSVQKIRSLGGKEEDDEQQRRREGRRRSRSCEKDPPLSRGPTRGCADPRPSWWQELRAPRIGYYLLLVVVVVSSSVKARPPSQSPALRATYSRHLQRGKRKRQRNKGRSVALTFLGWPGFSQTCDW